jgi:hypothetical protein
MVFNASNMEMNLMGSDHTNGRETSETQEEIIQGKGIAPIVRLIEYNVNRNIIPQRFGYGYKFDYKWQKNEKEELELDILKQQAGQETINEQRERLNLTIFDGDEFNKPIGSSIQPGQNGISPVYTKEVK